MTFTRIIVMGLMLMSAALAGAQSIESPKIVLNGVAADIVVADASPGQPLAIMTGGTRFATTADADGKALFKNVIASDSANVEVRNDAGDVIATVRVMSGWYSILPPLLAIFLALTLRNVIPALFVGIWVGAVALLGFTPQGIFKGMLDSFEVYVTRALADSSHAQIILFTLMIGGMVGIVTRSGGMAAIVSAVIKRANTVISGQVAVWAMGLVIFFDDYSNTLVVGNTARPISDKLLISREKLAYIVDSTAAPVATIALITTWVGYQLGLIKDAVDTIPEFNEPAYSIFLNSIPFSFYPIMALIFVLAIAVSGLDFGPMLKAEQRARGGQVKPPAAAGAAAASHDDLDAKPDVEERASVAILPILVLIGGLLVGLYATGKSSDSDSLRDIIGNADSYRALMWSSLCAVFVAAAMAIGMRILTVHETVDAWYRGVRAMFLAMIILVLAWSLSNVTSDLHTADYLVSILGDALPLGLVPAAIFIVSALTAFSTGTSWGTMGILMPLIVPLTWAIMQTNGAADPDHYYVLYSAVACNLAGAVWGDHCSPISDTTVLSSIASGCDHIEHVRTQLPYALLVGIVAIVVGVVPTGYGLPWWISLIVGLLILLLTLRFLGRRAVAQ
ncbi:MAG: Na+/H+ antiporter NhaC family protein [Gammaproteobacteria bacterium]|nr:Na+/H+ antiporter NhaC family protein [Gammaproteobacteria bacterium]